MSDFNFNKELNEVKEIKDGKGFVSWVKRKVMEVYGNAQKYPKTAFAVGCVAGFVVGKVF